MIAQALSLFLPFDAMAGESSTPAPAYAQEALITPKETVREYLLRIKDELLWPRILVRYAPPPDEVQPNAPDRF
jgi:hypothetical protein